MTATIPTYLCSYRGCPKTSSADIIYVELAGSGYSYCLAHRPASWMDKANVQPVGPRS